MVKEAGTEEVVTDTVKTVTVEEEKEMVGVEVA